LQVSHPRVRVTCFDARGVGGGIGFGPARMDKPRFDRTNPVAERAITLRRPRLPPKRPGAALLIAQ
jgi:hypothetical protein